MPCLDENVVLDFVEGRLSPEVRAQIAEHLDGCDGCRELVARTAEALVATGPASAGPHLDGGDLGRLPRGARIGRYRIIDVVGAGAMGVVYAAQDTVLRRSVALKVVRSQPGRSDDPLRVRLLREARAASAVRHANLVPVHDVLELDDGSPVLVMDLLTGETFRALLDRERVLSIQQTAEVLLPVLSALDAAHGMGVLHRDLKPENIFLCKTPEGALDVRIMDFGVAKLTASQGGVADTAGLTETGALVGTPYYMSPEQAFAERDIDGRTDLWAVGVMLYECLAGVRPTEARNIGQVLKTLAHLSMPPLSDVAPQVPAPMAALVGDLLCERNQRIPSAAQVSARLASIAAASGVPAVAASQDAPPAPPRPHTAKRSAIAVTTTVLLVGAIASVWWVRSPAGTADVAEPAVSLASQSSVMPALPSADPSAVQPMDSAQPAASPSAPVSPAVTDSGRTRRSRPPAPSATASVPQPTPSSSGPSGLLMTPPF